MTNRAGIGTWKESFTDPKDVGMKELLSQLPEEDIMGLAKTTTGGLIAPIDVTEAISVIINFSDAVSLLNRKRMKKEYLLQYLIGKKIRFALQADKTKLCQLILKLWGLYDGQDLKFNEWVETVVSMQNASEVSSQESIKPTQQDVQPTSPGSSSTSSNAVDQNYFSQSSSVVITEESNMSTDSEDDYQTEKEKETGMNIAFEFANWFYPRLNTLDGFNQEDFWNDCNFQLQQIGSNQTYNIHRDGPQVYMLLRSFVAEKGCYFNPNTLNGVGIRGKIDPHGLAQVMVSGTVHRGSVAIGVFEQVIGLMKDPTFNNSFKIKFSVLRVQENPALTSSTQNSVAIAHIQEMP